jgi:hypothetical protein
MNAHASHRSSEQIGDVSLATEHLAGMRLEEKVEEHQHARWFGWMWLLRLGVVGLRGDTENRSAWI